jgi:molybdopterin/thiamine biosynthesis adenylyltransferase
MNDLYKEMFSRNIGFLLDTDQEKLRGSTVGIAGVGGVGGLLAERLLRLGIGHLKITDPGDFEHSNINRQFCSSMNTIGSNKAEVIYLQLSDINPMAIIDWSSKGVVTQEDADSFVKGCDVVVDEMDFGLFREAIYLQRAARISDLYYMFVSAIGFGSLSVIFDPRGLTLEEYNNLDPDTDVSNFVDINVPLERICPVVPSYALSVPTEIVEEILTAERGAPTNSIGVGLASILAANEVVNILLNKRDITCAPKYTYIDLIDRQFIVGTVL